MDKPKLIEKLNEAIAIELAALVQYNQYSMVLMGQNRMIWQDFFKGSAEEALSHVRKFGERVVALGGTPSVEPYEVKQTADLTQMLENSLAVERQAVQVYTEALGHVGQSVAYRNMLEDHIQVENEDVEELLMLLGRVEKVAPAAKTTRKSRSA